LEKKFKMFVEIL